MEAVQARARAGEDFGSLAEAESHSQSRLNKGVVGNVRAGQLRPEIEEIAFALEPGEISEIIVEEAGLTLLYCEEILPAVERSDEELLEMARSRLQNQAQKRLRQELDERLIAGAELRFTWPEIFENPAAVVAEWVEGRVTVADLEALSDRPVASIPRQGLEAQVQGFVARRMARLEARRLGLVTEELAETRRWTRRQLLAGRALNRRVQARFHPPAEEEIRQGYEAGREGFRRPEHLEIEALQLPLDAEDRRPSVQAAQLLYERLSKGEVSFAEAARAESIHPSAAAAGRLGLLPLRWVNQRMGFQAGRAVDRLGDGEISRPVEEADSLWIFRVVRREPERAMTFEEARSQVEQRLGQARAEQLQKEITDELWRELEARDSGGSPPRVIIPPARSRPR